MKRIANWQCLVLITVLFAVGPQGVSYGQIYTPVHAPRKDFNTLRTAGNRSPHPQGIWSDGTTMWVVAYFDEKIYAYDVASKARAPAKISTP